MNNKLFNYELYSLPEYTKFLTTGQAQGLKNYPDATHVLIDYSGARNRVRQGVLIAEHLIILGYIGGTTNSHSVTAVKLNKSTDNEH